MIRVEEREKIRRAYFIEHKRMRQIAKELRHSRETVKKAIESAEPGGYRLKKPRPALVLGPSKARIGELLAESERMPQRSFACRFNCVRIVDASRRDLVIQFSNRYE